MVGNVRELLKTDVNVGLATTPKENVGRTNILRKLCLQLRQIHYQHKLLNLLLQTEH